MSSLEVLQVDEPAGEPDMDMISGLRTSITRLARSQRAHRQRDMRALPFSLSSVLSTLERVGPMTATQLAALEGVRKPSITRALAALEAQELIKRGTLPTDGRRQVIQITPLGIRSVKESRRIVDEWYAERLKQLSAEDIRALRSAIGALSRLAEEPA
jgi:DNA-binding MarR family transcriptional regulator